MKTRALIIGYMGLFSAVLFLNTSCNDDPIEPMDPNNNLTDPVWQNDSTNTNPNDSTFNDPNGGGNTNPNDSTWNDPNGGGNTNPNDSTWNDPNGGGNTNPNDSLGGGN